MIRNRLIAAFLVPTLALLALLGALIDREAERALEEELGHRLVGVAQATVGNLPDRDPERIARLEADDQATLQRLRERLLRVQQATGAQRVFLFQRTPEGRFRALVDTRPEVRFGDQLYEIEADAVEMERVFSGSGQGASSVLFTGHDGAFYKNGYAPISDQGRVVAALGVEGSASYFAVLGEFRGALLAFGALAFVLVILTSVLVARTMTRPIDALVTAARRFGRGDLTQDVDLQRRDEFQTLACAFNEMRADLLDRDEQMQLMLSGIAHEVRNPLGGMELFCGLLAEEIEPASPQAEYVGKVRKELDYLKRVVNDFLDYARRRALELERRAARDLLTEITSLLTWDLAASGATLREPDLDPEDLDLTVDWERLRPVLINLVRNAAAASPQGGVVTLSARLAADPAPERLDALARYQAWRAILPPPQDTPHPGPWSVITVADQGHGVAADQLEQIFKPFFTTREKGSGLGLALTTRCVEEHGGALYVASTPAGAGAEQGTCMFLLLPFKESLERAKMVIPEGWLG